MVSEQTTGEVGGRVRDRIAELIRAVTPLLDEIEPNTPTQNTVADLGRLQKFLRELQRSLSAAITDCTTASREDQAPGRHEQDFPALKVTSIQNFASNLLATALNARVSLCDSGETSELLRTFTMLCEAGVIPSAIQDRVLRRFLSLGESDLIFNHVADGLPFQPQLLYQASIPARFEELVARLEAQIAAGDIEGCGVTADAAANLFLAALPVIQQRCLVSLKRTHALLFGRVQSVPRDDGYIGSFLSINGAFRATAKGKPDILESSCAFLKFSIIWPDSLGERRDQWTGVFDKANETGRYLLRSDNYRKLGNHTSVFFGFLDVVDQASLLHSKFVSESHPSKDPDELISEKDRLSPSWLLGAVRSAADQRGMLAVKPAILNFLRDSDSSEDHATLTDAVIAMCARNWADGDAISVQTHVLTLLLAVRGFATQGDLKTRVETLLGSYIPV